ncbi:hypothetical protein [Mesorhizobium sp. M7A.F.Ca.MR.148.00.0.0]|uniref:hypothetical protein n=1 Tax=Mesorhizobium sp. M7A.F.Ca.MR.148.00.0.0 TaxID=2496775 RepID=UPI001FDFEFA1|nr:hypothetical protein [Mesorhizobium sp. M7A.F.Ca.MR.148.00.0.0]
MQPVFLRVAALAWAGLSLLLALHWFVELGMVGFPDGYVTPFARATGPLLHILATACLGQGLRGPDSGACADRQELPAFPDMQQRV